MPFLNDASKDLISNAKTIAIVGISDKPERDSYKVCKYLQEAGFTIYPINPMIDEVLGLKAYPSLLDLPEHIDIVDIFRKPEAVLPIVQESIRINAQSVWLQEGVIHEAAAQAARKAGLKVVMDLCIKKEHERLKTEVEPQV